MNLGRRVDVDLENDGYRFMHVTPTGSKTSVVLGDPVTATPAGSYDWLLLAVDNLDRALDELIACGGGRQRGVPGAPNPGFQCRAPSRGEGL